MAKLIRGISWNEQPICWCTCGTLQDRRNEVAGVRDPVSSRYQVDGCARWWSRLAGMYRHTLAVCDRMYALSCADIRELSQLCTLQCTRPARATYSCEQLHLLLGCLTQTTENVEPTFRRLCLLLRTDSVIPNSRLLRYFPSLIWARRGTQALFA